MSSIPTHDGLELGLNPALATSRSRTSEAELAEQPAPEWSAAEGRYVPEEDDDGDRTAVPTPALENHSVDKLGQAGEKGAPGAPSASPLATGAGGEKAAAAGSADSATEPIWVEWEKDDPENPYNWSRRRKWVTTTVVCSNAFLCNWMGAALGSGNPTMEAELGMSRELAALALGISSMGFAITPLVLAPVSETFGRHKMYTFSTLCWLLLTIGIARAQNPATVVVMRLLAGCAASPGSTLVGGSIADLWLTYERDPAMVCFTVMAFAGNGIGQCVSGWIEQTLGWRWIQYLLLILIGVECLALTFLTQETRGSYILSKRAARLRKETGDDRYQCRADAERASVGTLVRQSLSRPVVFLLTEPIVTMLALWFGFAWGVLFLCVEAVPLIMQGVYGFNSGQSGTVFLAVLVGGLVGAAINKWQEKLYNKHYATRGVEARLYVACYLCWLFPGGIFIIAFSQGRGHWMGPVVGLAIAFTGVFNIYQATFSFLADCYLTYASSAMSGQSLWRNLCAGYFPLFTYQMYQNLGYQNATALAGALASLLAFAPWLLFYFGPKLREKSKFASAMTEL